MLFLSCKNKKSEYSKDSQSIDIINKTEASINEERFDKNSVEKNEYKNPIQLDFAAGKRLEMLFSCKDFVYDEDYFRIPDYGCTYNPKNNPNNYLGWADVILLIKSEDKKKYLDFSENEIYELEEEVTSYCREDLDFIKECYLPIIFLIEKQYLVFKQDSELPYYPETPYVKKLFGYHMDSWYLLDSLEIFNEKDDYQWVDKNIMNLTRSRGFVP